MTSSSSHKASCRIDLAGGTLDLWPLYLYFGGLELVHMAIPVEATTQLSLNPQKSFGVFIKSRDVHSEQTYASVEDLRKSLLLNTTENPLRWVNRVVLHYLEKFKIKTGALHIETSSQAPTGSGLGGSSVLGVSLAKAFYSQFSPDTLKNEASLWNVEQEIRDLESIEIEHPAGEQDYVPALFGGLLIFKMGVHQRSIERLPESFAQKLTSRLALLYTGKPHHSGINNWQVFRTLHEQRGGSTFQKLRDIRQVAAEMASDFRKHDLSKLSQLIEAEWNLRKELAPAFDAPVLEEAWQFAKQHGATARKACGAGGGGCLFFVLPDETAKQKLLSATLPNSQWKWMNL